MPNAVRGFTAPFDKRPTKSAVTFTRNGAKKQPTPKTTKKPVTTLFKKK